MQEVERESEIRTEEATEECYCQTALSARFQHYIKSMRDLKLQLLKLKSNPDSRELSRCKLKALRLVNSLFLFKSVPHERVFWTIQAYNGCPEQVELINRIHQAQTAEELIGVLNDAKALYTQFRAELEREIEKVCPMLKHQVPFTSCFCPYSKIDHALSRKRTRIVFRRR